MRYCPLIAVWDSTIHKFQGFEAGFADNDNITYIIVNINTLKWEKNHPGTVYVVASRAKQLERSLNTSNTQPTPTYYTLGPYEPIDLQGLYSDTTRRNA